MAKSGSFMSEVYVDGANFYFNAQFNALLWSAQISLKNARFASISCIPPAIETINDDIEDAIAEWVHQTVSCCIGIVDNDDEWNMCDAFGRMYASQDAANNTTFETPCAESLFPTLCLAPSQGNLSANALELQCLRDRSKEIIHKFWEISLNYDAMRKKIDAEIYYGKCKR